MEETTALRLRKALNIRSMKQMELSEKTNIGKSAISQYLSGKVIPKQDKIYLMAKALNVNEAWLMGYDVEMSRITISYNKTSAPSIIKPKEKELLDKYRALDEKGQHTVSTILDMEYNRCTNDHLMPMAAHSDNEDDLDLIRQDLDEL
ncbi:MAG: helix-turn-helix domain-containing protein [Zhenhengia sp.]|uniref:helix-turn-helix domain-containing protein n=1 Tax=Zhenhengia sp. TaxID=2944208 RepID=UPI0039950721